MVFCLKRLRGTIAGANNRMDLLSIVTSGVQESEVPGPDGDILGVVEGWQDDETHNPEVPAISHTRGLTPFVFVPFEEVYLAFLIQTFIIGPIFQIEKFWSIRNFVLIFFVCLGEKHIRISFK